MAITATSSGTSLIAAIRSQLQTEFAAAKKTYQETGGIADVSENYASADGNVVIKLSGTKQDGKDVLAISYSTAGKEGESLTDTLTGRIDDLTGLPMTADEHGGGGSGTGSVYITSAQDIDDFQDSITHAILDTQQERDAQITGWQVGDKKFTSLADYQAYNRVDKKATDWATTIAGKINFKSEIDKQNFIMKIQPVIAKQMHEGGELDLSELLKDVPTDQLTKATKALTTLAGTDPAAQQLLKTLNDYIDDRKAQETPKGTSANQGLDLVV
jgi:hypothetical protein